jgi:RimJ/RimL family protein N-acetyltransferase
MAHSQLIEELWPLLGLRITGPGIELRVPDDDDLAELVSLAAKGIHPPETMPFAVAWTDFASPELERNALQYHWRCRSECSPEKWDLAFAVVIDGRIVGSQGLHATNFAQLHTVETGSWLGREHQGKGIGRLMRAVVVRIAFEHFGADAITSGAFADNPASQHVSLATGYQPNGTSVFLRRGQAAVQQRYLLTRQRWTETAPPMDLHVDGLDACRELLGLSSG